MNLNEAPKSLITSLCEFPSEYKTRILKMALAISQPKLGQQRYKLIEKFSTETGIPKDHIYEVLAAFMSIVRLFLENSDKEFNMKLAEIGFTSEFIDDLPLISNREEVIANFSDTSQSSHCKLHSLLWRIDISLVNSELVKKIPATVLLCFQFRNGKKYTVEVDTQTFHKLRFNVALILKELTEKEY